MNPIVNLSSDFKFPLAVSLAYLSYSITQNRKLASRKTLTRPKSLLKKSILAIYNITMSIYSYASFRRTAEILYKYYKSNGLIATLNDPSGELAAGMSYWIWLFYISKYVELIDTIIIHSSARTSTFLQTYHHSGAIICCWMIYKSNSQLSWIFVTLNSFVHTIMYCYYCFAALGFRSRFKKYITYMQITQFVLGSTLICLILLFTDPLSKNPALRIFQIITAISNLVYVAVLFFLFRAFAKRSYGNTKKNA